jgi:hypothetical protein
MGLKERLRKLEEKANRAADQGVILIASPDDPEEELERKRLAAQKAGVPLLILDT